MSEWRTVKSMMKNQKADIAVLWVTLILTVIFNLTIAIEIGLLLAVLSFLRRVTENTHISVLRNELDQSANKTETLSEEQLSLEKGVEVYEIDGPFFFGIANKFDEQMRILGDKPLVRIIRMRKVPFIDSTGIHNLEIFINSSRKENIHVILSGVNPTVHASLERMGVEALLGDEYIFDNIHKAVAKANIMASELKAQPK